jgi:dihydroorotate dehydrogenase electron transfer subunit
LSLELATDDGSIGPPQRVTELLTAKLNELKGKSVRVVCCGPEPMMEAVSEIAHQYQVNCEVSLETPMACGIGICFTCVAKIKQEDGSWDYKRTCIEGPIFSSEEVVW